MQLCGLGASLDKAESKTRKTRKVLVLGDGACGKTSMLNVLIKQEFPDS